MSWKIYHKDGSVLTDVNDEQITVHGLEYSDKWMEECFVTIDFKHEAPIKFAIGDYLIYRNGERFELNYDPGKQKQARANTYGEGFVYEGVKFNSLQDELARTDFIDVVLSDNQLHYTSMPKFQFYVETIDDLLDRIQENLDEQIGKGMWKIFSRNLKRSMQRGVTEEEWKAVYGDEETSTGDFDSQSITVDSQTCWQALALSNEKWDINFVVRNRNVYVGTAGKVTKGIFKYGLGKGLYEIEQNADSDQSIITRLRAYGSEKNLPSHYYADLGSTPFLNVTGDYKQSSTDSSLSVMLENSEYDGMWTNVKSDNGSNIKHVLVSCEIDGYKFDAELELVKGQSPSCTTRLLVDNNKTISDAVKAKIDAGIKQVLFLSGAKVTKFNSNRINYIKNLPNNMSISRLMLPGFPTMSLKEYWDSLTDEEKKYVNPSGREHIFSTDKYRPYIDSVNIERIGLRSGSQFFDTDDKTNGVIDIYPTIEEMVVGGVRIDEIYTGSSIDDNGRFDDGETSSIKNFDIYLNPAIDFDINDLRDDDFSISMKDGMCGGRSFKVASATKIDGMWRLSLERVKDDALDLYFPYMDYPIKKGDHFVLTGIELPESYIKAAALKLLKYAIALLDKNDYTRYVYQPKVDEIFMARQHDEAMDDKTGAIVSYHDTLKAGDIMQFEDKDLGIDAQITIDQLTIKEEDGSIPTYEITLREDKEVGTIEKIQQQISSLYSGNGGSGGGGATMSQVKDVVASEGEKYFLSKLEDDTAKGIITFMRGLSSEEKIEAKGGIYVGNGEHHIDKDGNAILGDVIVDRIHDAASTPSERVIIGAQGFDLYMGDDGKSHLYLDDLIVRRRFFASSAEIRKISYSGGTTIFSNAGSTLAKVSAVFDSEGTCVAYKCYACADDGTTKTMNWWHVGMMALCQTFNVKAGKTENLQNRYYWRLVVGVGQETLEDGKLYDYVVLSNKENFLGSDSYVPTYTDKVIADENEDMLVFGDYGVEVTTDGGMGSMAGVFFEQEGKDTDDGGNKIANRYFYGYEAVGGLAPDAPAAGDVIVQVGDQIRWKSRGNLIKLSTSTEDNATDNAPAITMYHNLGALYSTGKQDSDGNDIVSPYQWKSCTAVISPEMVKFNSNNFAWFSDNPDEIISPITVMYSIETSGMFRIDSDGELTGDNIYSGNPDARYVIATCYKFMGSSKEVVEKCWWEVSYNNLYVTTPYVGSTSVVMSNGDVADAPAYITANCYTLAVSESGTAMRGDTLLASVDIPVLRDGGKGDTGNDGATITITSTSVSYAKSSDNTMPDKNDDSLWQGTLPSVDEGGWLWTRTVVLYSDGTRLISVSVSRIGKDGTSVKIMSTDVSYKLTETAEQPSEFDSSFPTSLTKGWYLWTKTIVVYDDGNTTETLSVSHIGDDGKQGIPGPNGKTTHFAYADAVLFGDDGSVEVVFGFSTSMQSTSAYIGTYDDESLEDSEDWKDYSWTRLQGEKGDKGEQGEQGEPGEPGENGISVLSADVMYCVGGSDVNEPSDDADWKTLFSELILSEDMYVWSATKTVLSDKKVSFSGKQCLGKCEDFAAITEQYALGDSGKVAPVSGWGETYVAEQEKWLWSRSEMAWSDGSRTYTDALCIGHFAKDGKPGKDGEDGKNAVVYSVNLYSQRHAIIDDTYDIYVYVFVTKTTGTNVETNVINQMSGISLQAYADGNYESGLTEYVQSYGYIQRSAWATTRVFDIKIYDNDNNMLAVGSYSFGEDGEKGDKGDDGESGMEIIISPDTLAYDTNDDGIVTDYSQSAAIYCNKGGKRYTNVEYSLYGVLNCEATYSGGTIKITKIGTQTISYTDNGTSKSLSVSVTTGHVMMRVIDKKTGLYYYPLLRFSVNVAKFTGSMVANNKKFQTQFTEISNKYNDMEGKYDDLPLKNQSDLTEYTSTIEQTARKISLSVSEKAVGRRNLLVGSEFKRFDSGNMLSNGDALACRLRTGDQVDGYNSCRIVSDSTSYNYNGVVFKNIAVNANTTYALTTWAKRMSESLGAGCVVIVHEKKAFDGTVTSQQSWVLLSDAKDASGNYIDAVDEWKLKTRSFTTQSTTRYINVIFCVRTYGKFAVCKPILEEGDSYNGYSKSDKDYDYIGGNMIDNSRDLTRGGTLVGVAGTVQKTLNDDYADTIVTASGNASVGAFSIKKTLKAGVDYVLSWYIRRTSSDENGQCTVNLGRKILYSELHTGKQAVNSVEGGSSPYSGYQSIYPVPIEWTRMWVHFRLSEDWTDTDNQFYIQLYKGTADSITAQLSRPKLEEGAYPTEWTDNPKTYVEEGSMANKLLATGIDVVNKKVTVTADNFTVRNNSGVETMMVNEDGTLNAALVKAQQLETLGTNGQRIVIENGLLAVIGLAGVANWRFGLDDNNKSVLSYYDDNGNKLYDLGPEGLTKVKITEGTFTSGSYVNATAIGLSVSAYNSLYTTTHTSTSATGKVSVTETRLSNTSDDTILFKNVSSKTLGEQFNKTTLYQYRAPRVNDVIQADSGNNLTTQALAQQADGKYFTSKTICNGSSLQNLASGCFFAASSKIANQSKFIVAGLDQYDSISLSLYAIQSPISITNGAKSLGIVGQIRSREQYTQIGLADNSYVSID